MKHIQSIERAMLVLEELSAANAPLSLSYLAQKLSLKKSTLHGILNTLSSLGYVDSQHHLYTVGTGVFGFHPYIDTCYEKIKNKFFYHLDAVSKMTPDLVLLSLPCGLNEYICIEGLGKNNSLNRKDFVGIKEKTTKTPTGKVIQAFCHKNNTDNISQLNSEFYREINKIHNEGFATNIFEKDADIYHISAPLYDKGEAIAAISLVGTREQLKKRPLLHHLGILQGTSLLHVRHS
ncbi:helix-turn-helix domain-containing protein [Vibrio hannami]|uniref:helix-turn-helix domain-containing protein n=1 Tax=Vibrio hannami TaxID=2717094 RepID=UPI00240F1019|nr:helix-turn-helix domain-containing protein [Vibrio hannami]MDG3088564.1 helix-turn-helix domain-containing protein [Vibrio hannami]